ncbi:MULTISPECIES: ATP synthase I [Streptomyces]|uniref:ATP synthase I n=1 Tax=Streptomyces albus (strain ATCC 21838 / DSM 41398 / FERM P-419 / JCM 4703 / NBRC 107858) TaxID=1081613 RepID=A0A0B5ELB0_STRA4|nr:ATP synthase I [Streptomyces sp. SCSIO ZS0520]AJE82304.1 ATP synthase I [Streptomyces albus]AOU76620.1 ATP synthase I [Streptomyces albus]AYN32404.1 ATP synthase I [Streptomyces albus]
MPSQDARTLLYLAAPTAAVGAITAVVSGFVAGSKGAIGGLVGAAVVIVFMGLGLYVLQRTAKSLPQLFQAMGMMLYVAQLLLLLVFVGVFKDTSLFNPKAFALALVIGTVVWMAAQARAHMKAKIFYIDPESDQTPAAGKVGSPS